ncbi:hypothetical protein [Prosthecochloris sp. CIB 2401]|uniref:hypothetical protein n=1 Tax=Prosthecochloris sp. CIB 2401 TaxID=1868325 RepID=UPI00080AA337|nr:hypothetical protein [Prosthecochloris sp. CIB 2401]ANT64707.1 hypothetical protein Ptc2401_00920 [Prosthecochloris sp. CIB 2401]
MENILHISLQVLGITLSGAAVTALVLALYASILDCGAESMRVQSEVMRTKRTQRAEEIAAKIPVRLVLSLGLFIFPTLILVLLGPAAIQLMQVLSK